MYYISLGCNCLPALIFESFNLKRETLPFDWIPNTPKIVKDCLDTEFKYYTLFDTPTIKSDFNDELHRLQLQLAPTFKTSHINYYNNWFVHDTRLTQTELKVQQKRRISRFISLLNGPEELTFVFTNEHAIYLKEYYCRQKDYYNDLIDIQNIIINKYNKKNFKIMAFFVNEEFPATDYITTYSVHWDKDKFTENGELGDGTLYSKFREISKLKFKEVYNSI
jgi:hypothetical protein